MGRGTDSVVLPAARQDAAPPAAGEQDEVGRKVGRHSGLILKQ